MGERRRAVTIGDVNVGAASDKQSHDLGMRHAAVTEESTPPDMATTTRVSCGRPSTSRLLSIESFRLEFARP